MDDIEATHTQMRTLHADLAHMGRLNELGQMIAALAHELNQPLTAASNYLAAARHTASLPGNAPTTLDASLAKASAQLARAGEIVQRVRSYIRKADVGSAVENLEIVIDEAVAIMQLDVQARDIKLVYDLEASVSCIVTDKIRLQQVFVNLLRNAMEATEGRPERVITIATRHINGVVQASIADNGPGLSEAIASHLFEPFHTTKETGLGVGLSICRHIINSFGGRIWHCENQGGGAKFIFTHPLAASQFTQHQDNDACCSQSDI